jgi:ABC-type transport system involved in multi-copper enzyme maturation permease subunit
MKPVSRLRLVAGKYAAVLLVTVPALLAGESLLGRFLPGVRAISSREYALKVFDGVLDDDLPLASNAALTMLVVAAVCILLAVWRLRSMQVD